MNLARQPIPTVKPDGYTGDEIEKVDAGRPDLQTDRRPVRQLAHAVLVLLASAVAALSIVGTAHASASGDRLNTNEQLGAGERLVSADGRYALVMQTDGNLVTYGPSGATWSSNTGGSGGNRVVMQDDGNLVIYAGGTPVFATNTRGSRGALVMQNDSNLVEYTTSGPAWASNDPSERAIQWYYNHLGNGGYEGKCELAAENALMPSVRVRSTPPPARTGTRGTSSSPTAPPLGEHSSSTTRAPRATSPSASATAGSSPPARADGSASSRSPTSRTRSVGRTRPGEKH